MTSIHRASCLVRQWGSSAGLAAAAAAVIGMGTAHADDLSTDIGLLNSAEANVTDAFNVWTQAYGEAPPSSADLTQLITQTEAIQTPLLSSDNSLLLGLGESLFNGPDQQLAQASDAFLSAADAYAADPSTTTGLDAASASLQFDESLLFNSLPANVVGAVINQVLHLGGSDVAGAAATDLATSASATPSDVIGQAIADLNQGTALLDAAPIADLSARQADTLANSENLNTELVSPLSQMATLQDDFSATDQTFLANADEQLVTAAANMLSADQAFVAADQAGELSGSSFNSVDLTLIDGALGLLSADLNVGGAELFALVTGGLDPSSVADLAASLDPATAIDPSVVADVLSSIGL
ncbi:MAG TPA: hypothetical protein VN856_14380 [Mycobacterium sp.]|uniref:hypothetical protein n=1 Tax=Mycobacterium sp. TaxID=1785 RepID=UPI002C2371FB|nr:hypothetical protein [Mycobacterium sp.]HXO81067.1 hypothetical protein [Mycobacterium sp.]